MDREQHRVHALQEFGIAAVLAKDRLAFGAADARAVEVDVHHRLPVGGEADQERQALDGERDVRGVPAALGQEQVLPLLEAEQRDGLELPLRVLAKHDRVVRLDVAELGREREREHHVVAEVGAARGDDSQVLVIDVVQQDVCWS